EQALLDLGQPPVVLDDVEGGDERVQLVAFQPERPRVQALVHDSEREAVEPSGGRRSGCALVKLRRSRAWGEPSVPPTSPPPTIYTRFPRCACGRPSRPPPVRVSKSA